MRNFEHSSNCYNLVTQEYFQSWSNLNTLTVFPNEIKQEFYYGYSESSDSGSCESNTSPKTINLKQYIKSNSQVCIENQENDKFSENFMDSTDDDECLKAIPSNNTTSQINRGGRKQIKQGTTKRNARERNRVRYINNCFEVLRRHLPFELFNEEKNRKLSKVETLKFATIYIKQLTELLDQKIIKHEEPIYDKNTLATTHFNNFNTVSSCFDNKKESSLNGKKTAIRVPKIQFNNIDINIDNNKFRSNESENIMHSPISSETASISSHESSTHSYASPNSIRNHAYFNCGKASSFGTTAAFFTNNIYQSINSNNFF